MIKRTISIVTPVFNSMRTIGEYMEAILMQDYPHGAIEIVFADGGSTDGTLETIEKYKSLSDIEISVFDNPLRTGEAGKAVGVKKAANDVVCLLDSDNIIPDTRWITRLIKPFDDEIIVASQAIEYTYRREDGIINRYCALIGMTDPLCIFVGNYEHHCLITNKWTEIQREEIDCGDYLSVRFTAGMIPAIGTNGFFVRRDKLLDNFEGEYLFDIDVMHDMLSRHPRMRVAIVKTSIVHLFCQDIKGFARKQNRRVMDYHYFRTTRNRTYPWSKMFKGNIVLFVLCTVTVVPLLVQAIFGFCRKPDLPAWAFHIVACWVTLWVYGWGVIRSLFKRQAANRENWRQ